MNEQNIQIMLVEEVLQQINDDVVRAVLRDIFFDVNNRIDWHKVYESILHHMPELKSSQNDGEKEA